MSYELICFVFWYGHQSRSNHYPKVATPLVIFVNRRLARYGATVNIPFGALQRDNMKFESSKVFQNSRRVPFLEAGLLRYT